MSDFFTALGKSVCQELSRPSGRYPANPSVRAELGRIMGVTLNMRISDTWINATRTYCDARRSSWHMAE